MEKVIISKEFFKINYYSESVIAKKIDISEDKRIIKLEFKHAGKLIKSWFPINRCTKIKDLIAND